MARRDARRPRRRRDRYEEYDSYYDRRRPRQRRGGCLAPVRRFFRNVLIVLLTAIGAIVFFIVVLLITFHFAQFIQIMVYVFWIAVGLLVIWIISLVVHMISTISERMSQASERKARAKIAQRRADIEQERVHQAQLQVEQQEAKIEREAYQFYEQRQRPYYQSPRRTRNFREEEEIYEEQRLPRRTHNFREEEELVSLANEVVIEQKSQVVPHVSQLLGKSIFFGQKDMLYGFEMINAALQAIRGGWPGTAIIAGKSGSGKTRRVIIMVFQAIIAGMQITICDPHSYKPDGLIKVLMPFAPWLTFARSDAEIIAAAKEHIAEFESRLSPSGSMNNEGTLPRLIVFDEFPALMQSDSIEKDDKRAIAKCVRKSATGYRGFGGTAWIIGQEFTEDAIGDTAIRKDAHAILCHQLSDEYVKFLFPHDLKTQRLVQQIERRECIYKDQDNHTKRIITPTVTDEEIPNMVAYLDRVLPRPQAASPAATLHSRQTETEANPSRVYGAPAARARQQPQIVLGSSETAPVLQPSQRTTSPIPKRPRLPEPPQGLPITQPKQQRRTVQLPTDQHSVSAVWGEPILPQHPRATQTPQQVIPPRRLVAPLTTEDLAQMQKKPTPTTDALDDLDALAALRDQRQPKKK